VRGGKLAPWLLLLAVLSGSPRTCPRASRTSVALGYTPSIARLPALRLRQPDARVAATSFCCVGNFDSFNPYQLKGIRPRGLPILCSSR